VVNESRVFRNSTHPFQCVACEARRPPWLWTAILALFGLSFWGPYVHALGDSTNLAPLYAFIVGVLAQHHGRRLSDIRPSVATLIAILSVVVFCYFGTRKQTAPILLLECLSAAWLVALIAWRPVPIFRPLDFGPVRFYGKISYSFYLLHVLGMLFASRLLGLAGISLSGLPVSVATIAFTVLSVMVTTPAAYLSWRFIELPCIELGKRGWPCASRIMPPNSLVVLHAVRASLRRFARGTALVQDGAVPCSLVPKPAADGIAPGCRAVLKQDIIQR
jgi:peptidoglycan/LPS O-acetylase OafA/YrhL